MTNELGTGVMEWKHGGTAINGRIDIRHISCNHFFFSSFSNSNNFSYLSGWYLDKYLLKFFSSLLVKRCLDYGTEYHKQNQRYGSELSPPRWNTERKEYRSLIDDCFEDICHKIRWTQCIDPPSKYKLGQGDVLQETRFIMDCHSKGKIRTTLSILIRHAREKGLMR